MPLPLVTPATNPYEKSIFGDIEVKSASESKMQMSGFVSTDTPDLAGEIVQANAFKDFFGFYQRNALYCYDHDRSLPIGKVLNPYIVETGEKRGLYLEDITLTPFPAVKEIIWPLVLDGVLTQQSIGFFSVEGKTINGVYNHTKVFVLEGSLVPVACNPAATIDAVKQVTKGLWTGEDPSWEKLDGVEGLIKAHQEGRLRLPSEVRSHHFVSGLKTVEEVQADTNLPEVAPETTEKANGEAPVSKKIDFTDLVVLEVPDCLDMDGESVGKPYKNQKNYDEICSRIYAAKSTERGGYVFQVAYPTEKGFCYDWELVALSMGRVLGAQGGFHASKEAKSALVERIAEGYKALEKALPTVEFKPNDGEAYQLSIDQLNEESLHELAYSDVQWNSDESLVVSLALVTNAAKSIHDIFVHWQKSETGIPAEAKEILAKNLYGWVDVSLYAPISDIESLTFLTTVVNLIREYMTGDDNATDAPLLFSAGEGEEKEVNLEGVAEFLLERAKKAKAVSEPPEQMKALSTQLQRF